MRLKDQLLLVADRLVTVTGWPESRVSKLLFGKGNGLRALRRGADMHSANVEDGLSRLSALWPGGERWPCEVARPAPLAPRSLTTPIRRGADDSQ
jgi:hypothetical protein